MGKGADMSDIKTFKHFQENHYYVMTGNGCKWFDFDGPFSTKEEGVSFLKEMVGEYASPEVINGMALCYFKDNTLGLVKDDNGDVITSKKLYWERVGK
jgi:hypothetical protein